MRTFSTPKQVWLRIFFTNLPLTYNAPDFSLSFKDSKFLLRCTSCKVRIWLMKILTLADEYFSRIQSKIQQRAKPLYDFKTQNWWGNGNRCAGELWSWVGVTVAEMTCKGCFWLWTHKNIMKHCSTYVKYLWTHIFLLLSLGEALQLVHCLKKAVLSCLPLRPRLLLRVFSHLCCLVCLNHSLA